MTRPLVVYFSTVKVYGHTRRVYELEITPRWEALIYAVTIVLAIAYWVNS